MGDPGAWWGRGPAAMAPLTEGGGGGGGEALAGKMDGASGEERWGHFSSSVNAVSFGFVATAILISMFLVMAVFERLLRPRPLPPLLSPPSGRTWHGSHWHRQNVGSTGVDSGDAEAGASQQSDDRPHLPEGPFSEKLGYPSPKMSVYAKGISVVMPGNDMATFIAHPAPAACPPERISWPAHQ